MFWAITKPLFKKGDKLNPSYYSTIALLLIFSKVMENIVKSTLVTLNVWTNKIPSVKDSLAV